MTGIFRRDTVPKPGKDPEEVSSYRPISLLPILSKVLEKLILKRIKAAINIKEIIPEYQFGFREKHDTTEQVYKVVKKINKALEEKSTVEPL